MATCWRLLLAAVVSVPAHAGDVVEQLAGLYEEGKFVRFAPQHEPAPGRRADGAASGAFVSTNTSEVGAGGGWVEVSGACADGAVSAGWWLGVFAESAPVPIATFDPDQLPGNNSRSPFTAPFVVPSPLKFSPVECGANLSKAGSPGDHRWWVPNARQRVVFVLFDGGSGAPVERARSAPVGAAGGNEVPMHVRLARTAHSDEMRVSWTSSSSAHNHTVSWGFAANMLDRATAAATTTYQATDMCGEPARTAGWWEPGYQHSAVLQLGQPGPPPPGGTRVWYSVRSGGGPSSAVASFAVPAVGAATTLRVVLTADMGATTPDRVNQHWAESRAFATTADMAARAAWADLAFCVGDLSYATGYLGKWETFMAAIEPVSRTLPYMVAQGNHEQDWPGTGTTDHGEDVMLGRDSGGECGVPTAARFPMPAADVSPGKPAAPFWYTFTQGPVAFFVVNTELPTDGPSHPQYTWLARALGAVDRTATPWVVVLGHRPLWTPSLTGPDAFEDLLYEHHVDVTVAGHVHLAQHSCPVYRGACITNTTHAGGYDAPVHIIAGNGGQGLNNATKRSALVPWTGSGCDWNTANCSHAGHTQGSGQEWGPSMFEANATDFKWSFIGSNDSQVHYSFSIHRAYPRLEREAPGRAASAARRQHEL
eukprot:g2560.t1